MWVKHQDPISMEFRVDPKYALPRMKICDKRFLKRIEEQKTKKCIPDPYDPEVEWVVFD